MLVAWYQYRPTVILATYFCIIIILLLFTSPQWCRGKLKLWHLLALISLLMTWSKMFQYFEWSYKDYLSGLTDASAAEVSINAWLSHTKLFKQAWSLVMLGPERALISQRVCFATISWTLFLVAHNRSVGKIVAYMLLGQLVAVSFAMNLYFAALDQAKSSGKVASALPYQSGKSTLWVSVPILLALASACCAHLVPDRLFLGNLLFLHGILLVPCVTSGSAVYSDWLPLAVEWIAATAVLSSISSVHWSSILSAIFSNPAQESISADLLNIWICTMLWNGKRRRPRKSLVSVFMSLLSPFTLGLTRQRASQG